MKNWKKVPDNVIRFVWKCVEEDCECTKVDCIIEPDWYQCNGTPICECGCDMEYQYAEVADTSDNDDGYAVVETLEDEDDDLKEIERRDQKNGLYPEYADDCN